MLVKVQRPELVRPRQVAIPDRSGGRVGKVRGYAHVPEPGPNAPKLIRLIRNPISQELGRPVRGPDTRRRTKTEWMKPESAKMVREALSSRGRIDWPRVTNDDRTLPSRPRVSAEAWLADEERR